jgi:hypothetical protein
MILDRRLHAAVTAGPRSSNLCRAGCEHLGGHAGHEGAGEEPVALGEDAGAQAGNDVSVHRLTALSQMITRSQPGSPMPGGLNACPDSGAYAYQPVLVPRLVR